MAATLRLATEGDADPIRDIYAPFVEGTHVSFETEVPTVEEVAQRVRTTTERLPWLVCEHDGIVVGYAYASPHADRPAYRWSVDASVYVDPARRRHGVARGLYESLFAVLRRQGLFTAYAVVALPNEASVAFHEAMGFDRVGVYHQVGYKGDAWHDVGHWELRLQRHETPPSPPTPFPDIGDGDAGAVDDAIATGEQSVRL